MARRGSETEAQTQAGAAQATTACVTRTHSAAHAASRARRRCRRQHLLVNAALLALLAHVKASHRVAAVASHRRRHSLADAARAAALGAAALAAAAVPIPLLLVALLVRADVSRQAGLVVVSCAHSTGRRVSRPSLLGNDQQPCTPGSACRQHSSSCHCLRRCQPARQPHTPAAPFLRRSARCTAAMPARLSLTGPPSAASISASVWPLARPRALPGPAQGRVCAV